MFSLSLSVPFDDAAAPPELRFAFSQLLELFQGQSSKPEVLSELFWAGLHGIAELTRTKRFPRSRKKERVRALFELFTFPSLNVTSGEYSMNAIGYLSLIRSPYNMSRHIRAFRH